MIWGSCQNMSHHWKFKLTLLLKMMEYFEYSSGEDQGCRKLFRAGGRIARKGHRGHRRRVAGQRGRIMKKRHFAMFCYYDLLLILAQSKHKKLVHSPGGALTPISGTHVQRSPRRRGAKFYIKLWKMGLKSTYDLYVAFYKRSKNGYNSFIF